MDVLPAGTTVVAHWGFVADTPESWVTGELLLRDDGVLIRRYGGSSSSRDVTTWKFLDWAVVRGWPGHVTVAAAVRELRSLGYDLGPPSPIPIDHRTDGDRPE